MNLSAFNLTAFEMRVLAKEKRVEIRNEFNRPVTLVASKDLGTIHVGVSAGRHNHTAYSIQTDELKEFMAKPPQKLWDENGWSDAAIEKGWTRICRDLEREFESDKVAFQSSLDHFIKVAELQGFDSEQLKNAFQD